jgi:hypothetical protein
MFSSSRTSSKTLLTLRYASSRCSMPDTNGYETLHINLKYKHKHSTWTTKIIRCIGTLHTQLLTAANCRSYKRLSFQLLKAVIQYVLMEL